MSKLPDSILLLGHEIPIIQTEKLSGRYAEFDAHEMAIRVSSDCAPEHLEVSLLHELCHAIFCICGVDQLLPLRHEEALCHALEHLLQVYVRRDLCKRSKKSSR